MASLHHHVRSTPASLAGAPHLCLRALGGRAHSCLSGQPGAPSCIRSTQDLLMMSCGKTPTNARRPELQAASLEVNSAGPLPNPGTSQDSALADCGSARPPGPAHLSFLRSQGQQG